MAIKKEKAAAAGAAMYDKFFSSADGQEASRSGDPVKPTSNKGVAAKAQEKPLRASEKKVFSFRGDPAAVTAWRLYADAAGMKVDDLGAAAMAAYIEDHPLTKDQKKVFDLKLKMKS